MHNITLYGVTRTNYNTLTFVNKLTDKVDVEGIKSISYDFDCTWLRPGLELETDTKTGAGGVKRNDGVFRKKFEIDIFPQKNQPWDTAINQLSTIFSYYSTFIGINNFLYDPFAGSLSATKAMPITLLDFGYDEVNSVYRTITLELHHKL